MSRLMKGMVIFAAAILILILAGKHGAIATYACSLNFTSCYMLIEVEATWSGAKDECERVGAYLFEPSEAGEEEFLYEYIGKLYNKDIWLGCSDDTDSRDFKCLHESIDLNGHKRWKKDRPQADRDSTYQWAMYMKKGYPTEWEEKVKTDELGYVCELPRPQPGQPLTHVTPSRTCSAGTFKALSNLVTGRPIPNLCANGSPLRVIDPTKNVKRCGMVCIKEPDCFSFNYIRVSEGVDDGGRCEMMGVVNGTLRDQEGCQYYTLV